MKQLKLLLLTSIAILLTACSGGGGSSGGDITPVDINGSWKGTWSSSVTDESGTVSVVLLVNGTVISGSMDLSGSPCISTGSIDGTVSGNSVSFGVILGDDEIQFSSTYSDGTISGTYSVTSGLCSGDTGTFILNKDVNEEPLITTLASNISNPAHLKIKDINLFWSDGSDTPIKNMLLTEGNITSVVRQLGDPINVVVNGQNLYWIGSGTEIGNTLYKSTLDGTSSTVLTEGKKDVEATNDIILDDTNVYWVNSTSSPNTYTIEKVPLAGGESTTLVSTLKPIMSMTRDATHLYWLEGQFPDPCIIKKMPLGSGAESVVVDGNDTYNSFTGNIVVQGSNIFVLEIQDPYPDNSRLIKFDINSAIPTFIADIPALPKMLAIDESNVYWIDSTSVNYVSVNGGTITTLASGLDSPVNITLDSQNVFWVETICCAHGQTGSIKKVPISGGTVTTLIDEVDAPQLVVLDAPNMYWIEGGPIGEEEGFGRIAKMPIEGGIISTVISGITGGSMPIAVDDLHVYFADRWTIKKVSQEGGSIENLAIANFYIHDITTDGISVYWIEDGPFTKIGKVSVNGGVEEILSNELSGPSGPITIHNSYVFWMAHYDTIAKVSIDGGLTEVIAAGLPFLSDFVVDDTHAYFSEQDTGDIKKVSINDGTITELIGLSGATWRKLAVDSQNLYWIDQVNLGKIPIGGGTSTIIDSGIQSDVYNPNSIVIDSTSIYWTEVGSGKIKMAQPK